VSEKTQLFVGLRRKNGQIGYLSESLTIPEFFELISPSKEARSSLVDFSPVIETLHLSHEKSIEQTIREKYNAVFNYWQESKSYSNMQIRLPKFESLSLSSNELINSLQFRIEKSTKKYAHRSSPEFSKNTEVIKTIQQDSNTYIDVLLCFIHSKASLEIESFQNDVVLTQYCNYLKDIISRLFNDVVEYSTWENNFNLQPSSLLYHLAFNNDAEIDYYTKLLPSFDNSKDLRLALISESSRSDSRNHSNEEVTKIEIKYRKPLLYELETARILRDILYKIDSLSKLLKRLKQGEVDWNPSKDAVEELQQSIFES
jgi:hypothetical protein